jgi:surfeit locus 1 family protein
VSRRSVLFVALAAVVAAGCVRLGFWQLHRLAGRRALNARLASRLDETPVAVRTIVGDSAAAEFRRATAAGTYDFANEFALAARTREGSPGVNIITPLRAPGTDTAVLVNRGWVYAPDAMTIDFARWKEPPAASDTGYLLAIPSSSGPGAANASTDPRVVRRLERDSLARRFPYPIAPFLFVATQGVTPGGSASRDSIPARLPPPLMDEGPHLGYAIQWFSFAAIALVGAAIAVRTDRRGSQPARRA